MRIAAKSDFQIPFRIMGDFFGLGERLPPESRGIPHANAEPQAEKRHNH